MSAQTKIAGKAPAAMHCAELTARRQPAPDPTLALGSLAGGLAPHVAEAVASLTGRDKPDADIMAPELTDQQDLHEAIGSLAANFVFPLRGSAGSILASFAVDPLLEQVDRLFGGAGSSSHPGAGKTLHRSVELLARKLERGVAAGLADALGEDAIGEARLLPDLAKQSIFGDAAQVAQVTLFFPVGSGPAIGLRLACNIATLPHLGAGDGPGASARPASARLTKSFGDIPLPLRATLVDMRMPAHRLAALEVGAVLPVAIARSVPLKAGHTDIARGTVGELDDRTALQIETILYSGDGQ